MQIARYGFVLYIHHVIVDVAIPMLEKLEVLEVQRISKFKKGHQN
jgi:hypothetical protein